MNTQSESKPATTNSEVANQTENPMQEQHSAQVAESVEVTAEAVFTARKYEVQGEAGPVFVP